MVKIVVITVWIRRVQGCEKVKDGDEAHRKYEGVYSRGEVNIMFPGYYFSQSGNTL